MKNKIRFIVFIFTSNFLLPSINAFAQRGYIKNDTIEITYKIRPTIKKNTFIVKIKKRNLTNDTMITIGDHKWKLKYLPHYVFYYVTGRRPLTKEWYSNSQDSTLDQLENGSLFNPPSHVYIDDYRPKHNYVYLVPKERFKYKIKIILLAKPTKLYVSDRYFVVKNLNHNPNITGLVEDIWFRFTKSNIIYMHVKLPKKLKLYKEE